MKLASDQMKTRFNSESCWTHECHVWVREEATAETRVGPEGAERLRLSRCLGMAD
jgi:hypothetical protein